MTYAATGPTFYFGVIAIVFGMNRLGVSQTVTLISGLALAAVAIAIIFWVHRRTG